MKTWANWVVLGALCVGLGSLITATVELHSSSPEATATAAPAPTATAAAKQSSKAVTKSVAGLEGVETVTGGMTYFTVTKFNPAKKSGTLTFIAGQYHTTVAQLVRWNHIANPDVIHVNQRLRVK